MNKETQTLRAVTWIFLKLTTLVSLQHGSDEMKFPIMAMTNTSRDGYNVLLQTAAAAEYGIEKVELIDLMSP